MAGCDIAYAICANEAEFTLGGRADGFDFIATEEGLEQLIAVGTEALQELRARSSDEDDELE